MKKLNKINLLLIGVILLSLAMITSSFAWLSRPNDTAQEGKDLNLNTSAVIKSSGCTAATYSATMNDGSLSKSDTAVTATYSFTVPAEGTAYFVTEISNSVNAKNNISLTGLALSGDTANVSVHVLSPTKNYAAYSANMSIIEHAVVEAGGTLTVEWYVYNSSGSDLSLSLTSLPSVSHYG